MGLIAAERLVTPEFDVARVDVRHGRSATEGIVGRREPFFTGSIGVDGEVVSETGGIVGTWGGGGNRSKHSKSGGEFIVYPHTALHSGAATTSPTTKSNRDADIATLVRGNSGEAVAKGIAKEMRLGDEIEVKEIESRGVDVSLGMDSITPNVPITSEDS